MSQAEVMRSDFGWSAWGAWGELGRPCDNIASRIFFEKLGGDLGSTSASADMAELEQVSDIEPQSSPSHTRNIFHNAFSEMPCEGLNYEERLEPCTDSHAASYHPQVAFRVAEIPTVMQIKEGWPAPRARPLTGLCASRLSASRLSASRLRPTAQVTLGCPGERPTVRLGHPRPPYHLR